MDDFQTPQLSFTALSASLLPDLYVFTGTGWEDGIIVSDAKGGSPLYALTTDDTLYISFAVVNYGDAPAGSFAGMLLVDNVPAYSLEYNSSLKNKSYTIARDVYLGALAAGRHILTIQCDYFDSVEESNELNNDYSVIITVTQGETSPADCLLDTRWNQNGNGKSSYNYNKFVPDGLKTGCSNTALAQMLYYWAEQGYAIQIQVTSEDRMTRVTSTGTETIGAANLENRCGISLDDLNGIISTITCDEPNWDDDDDIAGLTLASMLILNSEIGDSATATTMFAEANLLARADFNYDCVKCSSHSSIPWDRIQENIHDGCPVFAGLKSIMHTLVIDGYNPDTDDYHLNFGWGFEGYKNNKKYDFYTGTGWYSMDELELLDITFLVLDVYPNYDIDDPTKKPVIAVDWSDKITPEMSVEDGFYVTVATPSQLLSFTVSQKGANIFLSDKNATLSSECMDGTPLLQNQKLQTAFTKNDEPLLLQGIDNGLTDVFFARPCGTWNERFQAAHDGGPNGWKGTKEIVSITGKNKFCDIFEGTGNTAILRLTDDACGDALFADDIYSDSYGNLGKTQSRITNLHEVIAGAGDDVIDMTSGRFIVQSGSLAIHGNEGNDVIWGGPGRNTLFGDAGNDRLTGGPDNDVIVGGTGDDSMAGEGGNDIFCFCDNWGNDQVFQNENGTVTLWFASGSMEHWDDSTLTYSFNANSVSVSGVSKDRITLKFGDDTSELYEKLKTAGAFNGGILA